MPVPEYPQYIEGILLGVLAGVCIIYGFQTRVKYPLWMVKSYDHPWIILVFILLSVYVLQHNAKIGAMLLIMTMALIIDGIIFTRTLKLNSP
jgi:succinate dehydrogenase hydrophobic anchor subunit